MKLEYDKSVDAAYIYLDNSINNGEVSKTIELNSNIILDLDSHGKIIGIEILSASKVLNKEFLVKAKVNN